MEELRMMKVRGLFKKTEVPDDDFYAWLEKLQLITTSKICTCGAGMALFKQALSNGRVKRRFRCKRRDCRKCVGFFTGTFFENAHITPKDIFELSYFWSLNYSLSHEEIISELQVEGGDKFE